MSVNGMNNEFAKFAKGLFDTKELPTKDGYDWTLASRISDMLYELEGMFGERDKLWTILGAEISMDSNIPQNWHPGGGPRKHIVFQLVPPADTDIVSANYQLAHEVVHALSPNIDLSVNVLEEGLATWFSRYYVNKHFDVDIYQNLNSYREARELVARLLEFDKDAVKKLRHVEPCLKRINSGTFKDAGLSVETELILKLTAPFERL